jgi:predicted phage-related endonuclease
MTTTHTTHGPTATELMEMLQGGAPATTTVTTLPSTPLVRELTAADLELLREFKNAKALAKLADELKDAAEEKIRDLLGDATIGVIDNKPVVKVNAGSNSRLDSSTVRDGWPEAYDAAKRTTEYTYLTVESTV